MTDENDEPIYQETTIRFWIFRLIRKVRENGLYILLAPIQRVVRHLLPEQIKDARVALYSPSVYDGWHWGVWCGPRGDTVYRVCESCGVELLLTDGTRWFIGSERPGEFQSAIEQIMPSAPPE